MRKLTYLMIIMAIGFAVSCTNGQTNGNTIGATAFAEKIKVTPSASIVDVRTPEEFIAGHLEEAKNIDWRGIDFEKKIATLDKNVPVMIYCLSGGRSSSAVNKMQKMGFTNIIELEGGIMQWRANSLPEATERKATLGMSMDDYKKMIHSDKMVLVDFYAPWCAPCKKMKVYLEEIAKEKEDTVSVIRIDIDKNPALAQALKVSALPTLHLYKSDSLTWSHVGFLEKSEVVKVLE